MYIISLIPPITQNFARNPILKSNIGATSGLFREIFDISALDAALHSATGAEERKGRNRRTTTRSARERNEKTPTVVSGIGACLDGVTTVGVFSYRSLAERVVVLQYLHVISLKPCRKCPGRHIALRRETAGPNNHACVGG